MRFEHRDGADATAGSVSLGVRDDASIDEDGVFEIDGDRDDLEDVVDRLTDAGHDPLEAEGAEATDEDDGGGEIPPASAYDEQTIVEELGYGEKQAIATQYDHIKGNASDDELTEALIEQRRAEVDD